MFAGIGHSVVEAILHSTHIGVLYSAAGDLSQIALPDYEIFAIKERKITRHATYYDALGFMQQLGVMPEHGQLVS